MDVKPDDWIFASGSFQSSHLRLQFILWNRSLLLCTVVPSHAGPLLGLTSLTNGCLALLLILRNWLRRLRRHRWRLGL